MKNSAVWKIDVKHSSGVGSQRGTPKGQTNCLQMQHLKTRNFLRCKPFARQVHIVMRTEAFASIDGWWQLLLSMLFHMVILTLISSYFHISSTMNKNIKRPRYHAPSVGTSDDAGERERERKISKEFLIFGFWVAFLHIWGTYQDFFLKVIAALPRSNWFHPPSHGELSSRGVLRAKGALHLKNWRKLPESAGRLLVFCQIFVP